MRSTLACQLAGRPGSCSMARPSLVLVVEPPAMREVQRTRHRWWGVGAAETQLPFGCPDVGSHLNLGTKLSNSAHPSPTMSRIEVGKVGKHPASR